MAKRNKIQTPDWILRGIEPPKKKEKGKTFKIRKCPKCKSDRVQVLLSGKDSEEGGGKEWICKKCNWKGKNAVEKELSEEEFMKYLDDKGEEVA